MSTNTDMQLVQDTPSKARRPIIGLMCTGFYPSANPCEVTKWNAVSVLMVTTPHPKSIIKRSGPRIVACAGAPTLHHHWNPKHYAL